jgi:hypothetical protein
MSIAVRRLLNHLPHLPGRDGRIRMRNVRDAQRASFMESSGYRTFSADRYERSLRRRRAVRGMLYWLGAVGAAWVVLESARAVQIF